MSDLRSSPENIEYVSRLKWGTTFQYTTKEHSAKEVLGKNYFHNLSGRYFMPGDEIQVALVNEDGSWSKCVVEVASTSPTDTVVEVITDWRKGGKGAGKAKAKPALENAASGKPAATKQAAPKKAA